LLRALRALADHLARFTSQGGIYEQIKHKLVWRIRVAGAIAWSRHITDPVRVYPRAPRNPAAFSQEIGSDAKNIPDFVC